MTKQEALDWAGGTVALAEKLGITPGAVSHWDEETGIPELQQHKLWKLSAGTLKMDKKYEVSSK